MASRFEVMAREFHPNGLNILRMTGIWISESWIPDSASKKYLNSCIPITLRRSLFPFTFSLPVLQNLAFLTLAKATMPF